MDRTSQIVTAIAIISIVISTIAIAQAYHSGNENFQSQITSLQNSVNGLQSQITSLQNSVNGLNQIIDQQQDQINRLKIPLIVKEKIGTPTELVSYFLTPFMNDLKKNVSSIFYPIIDDAQGTISSIIGSKISYMTVEYVSATRISGSIYDANVKLTIPVSVSEIPLLSSIQNIIGDITFYPSVSMSARIDVSSETVTNIQYQSMKLG